MYNPSSFICSNSDFVCTLGIAGGTLLYARNFIFGKSVTTPVNDAANECPLCAVNGSAPSTQFPGAVERSTLPLACVGPLYNIALSYTLYLPYLKTTFGNLHFILSRAQAHQKQPHLALTHRYIVGKGYEVSVLDEAPNVPDKQVEREKLPVEYAAFPFVISLMAVPDASTVIAVSALGCGWNNIISSLGLSAYGLHRDCIFGERRAHSNG
ncbi:hypothetical protein T03_18005 [Trichinella britovi]|uniref:Uncharacterized protein n=1 Tax=Trichinella britovi TaxID=45882 RepID=A0A0V1C921_TRIBR|nr:hypothetical protein T03_17676 [Trichinella britovi]KRY45518.1 hypothetical protein T03_18005 [Trichinella britovi]